ncbi:plasmid stabilization system protein [Terriglobus roseus DSM 18391]|uniref:Plasmid stabilization system protein n=1 Tax=Terriglobus roseus (strain DSM 18391 / NRRL B-41598 / KBS 63) TaxID=926566 RepID=I3ZLR0_TERRK|nr:plasmid stabilization system protein [Terriglobus roseus DSM 18391]
MKRHRVSFTKSASNDLLSIWSYIAKQDGPDRADAFTETVVRDCFTLQFAPVRGTPRVPERPGVRTVGAAKGRVTLIFRVTPESVQILPVHYAGRDHGFR